MMPQLKNRLKSLKPQASSTKHQAPRPALMMPQLKNRLKIERNK